MRTLFILYGTKASIYTQGNMRKEWVVNQVVDRVVDQVVDRVNKRVNKRVGDRVKG